jgi:HEAT repeat protein
MGATLLLALVLAAQAPSGGSRPEAIPDLVAQLRSRDWQVRNTAQAALAKAGAPAVPALMEVLRTEKSEEARQSAAAALGAIGPDARAATPLLVEALSDPDTGYAAAEALVALKADVAGELVKAAGSVRKYARIHAALALGKLDPRPDVAVPTLVALASDPSPYVAGQAFGALGHIGEPARAAVPVLMAGLKDESLASAAASALTKITPGDPALVTAFSEGLAAKGAAGRRQACAQGLAAMGPAAAPAVSALVAALADENEHVRATAAQALARVGPAAGESVPALARLVKDPNT